MVLSPQRKKKTKRVKGTARGTKTNRLETTKKKATLLILSWFIGKLGADRIYSGQIMIGLLKLVLYILSIVFFYLEYVNFPFYIIDIWYFVDYAIVTSNSLSKSKKGVFGIRSFDDEKDIDRAYSIAWASIILFILGFLFKFFEKFFEKMEQNTKSTTA
jgi:hypothetical protein